MKVETPHDRSERLDAVISAEAASALFEAALWSAAVRRGAKADERNPSIKSEALQRLYYAGVQRGRKEERLHQMDDGK